MKTRECIVRQIGKYTLDIILTQGVNRQIRRMCEACGWRAREIKRIRVMNVTLGKLKPGEYEELSEQETERLYRDCGIRPGK